MFYIPDTLPLNEIAISYKKRCAAAMLSLVLRHVQSYDKNIFRETFKIYLMTNFGLMTDLSHKIVF